MPESAPKPIFLSYASQDADVARRICDALRAAGLEVWFDQSELRGGDAWDASIHKQIKECALFVPIISANTQAREEGYFRLEWKLAVDRSHLMAAEKAFLLPVVIDDTANAAAIVPQEFKAVQWTRLPDGERSEAFAERVRHISLARPLATALEKALEAKGPSLRTFGESGPVIVPAIAAPPSVVVETKPSRERYAKFLKVFLPVLLLALIGIAVIPPWIKKFHARYELIPAVEKMAGDTFRADSQIFDMATQIESVLPGDPALVKLWPEISTTVSMETEPAGAEVFWKDYDKPDAEWRLAGVTPIKDVRLPRSYLRMEIRKAGYQTVEYAGPPLNRRLGPEIAQVKLDARGSLPENMVRIPKGVAGMAIVGLEKNAGKVVPDFFMDKFEVTNKQFKAFVDAGGYTKKAYWNYAILNGGKEIPWSAAMQRFTDRTGRVGPASWEAGSYLDNKEDHPVTGISWYEAAAYAAYAKKQLPTIFHWSRAAATSRTQFIVPLSNFGGKSTTPVGSLSGFNSFGVYDLAGNAREWIFNQGDSQEKRFIMGGGWNDPTYSFNDGYTQPALDRGLANGFRCIKEISAEAATTILVRPVPSEFRDYAKEKPADDKSFAIYARQYSYDKTPLDSKIEPTLDRESWNAEIVEINTGYNKERMQVYVYLPKKFMAPLQAVIYFPGSGAIHSRKFVPEANGSVDFIIKSGRALVVPVYKGTHQRHDELASDLPDESVLYKDHVIMWRKDIGRTIDYLETRSDIQADKVAFLGWSWGGYMGGIIPAVEKRIKVVVLNVGGMVMQKSLPEVDQINFLPRISQPVLMLNGKHDMYFPLETSQKPMFNLLGTPAKDKKMIVYDAGHLVPRTDFIKETLGWLDTYLGPAK